MTTLPLHIETGLERAVHTPAFPAPIRLHPEVVREYAIDVEASAAFGDAVHAQDIDVDASLKPALATALNGNERASWFGKHTVLFTDVLLVVDDPGAEVSHHTIWLLLNRTRIRDNASLPGFALPAARRVNGISTWLQPLCLPLDGVTYAANTALSISALSREV